MAQLPRDQFLPIIRDCSPDELRRECESPCRLLMSSCEHRGTPVETAYAPFDYVNAGARIILVGMTPGRRQMRDALLAANAALRAGETEENALARAKSFASFAGPMRANLVGMLDGLGVARLLRIETTADLWGRQGHLSHFTSMLRYPTFVAGENYSGSPAPSACPMLDAQVRSHLLDELKALPEALVVPLGPLVAETVMRLPGMDPARVLAGLPHPSGANGERIAYFMGRKPRALLSAKCDPDKLDDARARLTAQVEVASRTDHLRNRS